MGRFMFYRIFIYKCYCSNPLKFVTRLADVVVGLTGRYKSSLGTKFHLCVLRLKLNQSTFFDRCVKLLMLLMDVAPALNETSVWVEYESV